MKIRNTNHIKNFTLAAAVIALAAPMAHAQGRVYNSVPGRSNSQMYNNLNTYNGFYLPAYSGFLNNYNPYFVGAGPNDGIYAYGSPYAYRTPGAVVMGSNGQIVDTTPYPYTNGDGVEDQSFVTGSAPGGVLNVPTVQLNDQIAAVRLSGNRVKIAWDGDPRPIASMRFALLDSRRNEVRITDVNGLPAQATFTRPSNAVYYRVTITYGDGAVRSLIGSL